MADSAAIRIVSASIGVQGGAARWSSQWERPGGEPLSAHRCGARQRVSIMMPLFDPPRRLRVSISDSPRRHRPLRSLFPPENWALMIIHTYIALRPLHKRRAAALQPRPRRRAGGYHMLLLLLLQPAAAAAARATNELAIVTEPAATVVADRGVVAL